MKTLIIDFLRRFFQDNPRAAKAVQLALIVLAVLPYVLKTLGVDAPALIEILTHELTHWAELVGVVAFQFPNKSEGSK